MQILIGFMLCSMLVIAFTLGGIFQKRYNMTLNEKEATITTLEKEAIKRQQGFNNIMNYDIKVAMGEVEQQ